MPSGCLLRRGPVRPRVMALLFLAVAAMIGWRRTSSFVVQAFVLTTAPHHGRSFVAASTMTLEKKRILGGTLLRDHHHVAALLFASSSSSSSSADEATTAIATTADDDEQQQQSAVPPLLGGGDFAGLFATFDLTGQLIPVPAHYVPEALLEWGQAPPALEVLVSEDTDDDDKGKTDESSSCYWNRQELTILPETGCGVDNLEVIARAQEISKDSVTLLYIDDDDASISSDDATTKEQHRPAVRARTLAYPLPNHSQHRIHVECTFGLGDGDEYRSRLGVDLLWKDGEWNVQRPLRWFLERQVSTQSSHGSKADGGGLDGRTVSRWIGSTLRQYEKQLETTTPSSKEWQPTMTSSSSSSMMRQLPKNTIHLPGNLTLAFGHEQSTASKGDEWVLQVGQIYPSTNEQLVIQHVWRHNSTELASVQLFREEGTYITSSAVSE